MRAVPDGRWEIVVSDDAEARASTRESVDGCVMTTTNGNCELPPMFYPRPISIYNMTRRQRSNVRAIVHFSVGVFGMVCFLTLVDLNDKNEFVLLFASGFWALVPDLGWLLLRLDLPQVAMLWKAVFNSPFGNLFWFAPLLDAAEPVNRVFEMTAALTLLGSAVLVHYFLSDWDIDQCT